MRSHESIECIFEKGLQGCAGGKSKHRQVTILSLAAWNEAQEELGAVSIWSSICHGQISSFSVRNSEILIFEFHSVD